MKNNVENIELNNFPDDTDVQSISNDEYVAHKRGQECTAVVKYDREFAIASGCKYGLSPMALESYRPHRNFYIANEEYWAPNNQINIDTENRTSDGHYQQGDTDKILDEDGNLLSRRQGWSDLPQEQTADCRAMVDIVEHQGEPAFLMEKDGNLFISQRVIKSGRDAILVPPPRNKIPFDLVLSGEVISHYSDAISDRSGRWEENLFHDTDAYFKASFELSSKEHYLIPDCWIPHTYLPEKAFYTPILMAITDYEGGKSRLLKALTYLGFRGYLTTSLDAPHVLRTAHRFRGVISFDVYDLWQKAGRNIDMILDRFERGKLIQRVNKAWLHNFEDTDYYDIFGPTTIGTNVPPPPVFASRGIELPIAPSDREFPVEDARRSALVLKAKYLAFRAKYKDLKLPVVPKPAPRRLGDIMTPLNQMIRLMAPDQEPAFLDLVTDLQRTRLLERSESLEAQIVRAIIDNRDKVDSRDRLAIKIVTETLNQGIYGNRRVDERTVGRRVKALAFRRTRTQDNCSALLWDVNLIRKLSRVYGLEITPETP
jgi:hypothetical protein